MSLSNEAVVNGIYKALLHRLADSGGLKTYMPVVASGSDGVALLIDLILKCEEYLTQQHYTKAQTQEWTVVEHFGARLSLPSNSEVIAETRSPEGYEPHVLPIFMELIRPGMTVLDIGASLGTYSVPAAAKLMGTGKVFSVEVSSKNCEAIQRSIIGNGLDNLVLLPFGASDHVGGEIISNLISHHNYTVQSLAQVDLSALGAFTVIPVLPLDCLSGTLGKIDVIKMDIEGSEYRALSGSTSLLGQSRPYIFSEYSPGLLRRVSGVEPTEMIKLLHNFGYKIEVLHRNGFREKIIHNDVDAVVGHIENAWNAAQATGDTHLDLFAEPR